MLPPGMRWARMRWASAACARSTRRRWLQTPDGRAFEIVSAPLGTSGAEFREIARAAASADTLERLLAGHAGALPGRKRAPSRASSGTRRANFLCTAREAAGGSDDQIGSRRNPRAPNGELPRGEAQKR